MQSLCCHHMRLDQVVQRPQSNRARANLVRQGRNAQINPLQRVAVALAVQRLMLTVLLEQDHSQQVGSRPTPGVGWNGAGGWLIFSQCRQVNFSTV